MIAALSNPSAEVVRLLLAKGADPKPRDQFGTTAFLFALEGDDIATIRMLTGSIGDVNETYRWSGFTMLIRAAEMRNLEMVKMLLAKGANVNAVSPHEGLPVLKVKNGTVAAGSLTSLMWPAPMVRRNL